MFALKIYIHSKIFDFTRLGMGQQGIVQMGDKGASCNFDNDKVYVKITYAW